MAHIELKDLLRPCLITSYDIKNRRTVKFFFNQKNANAKNDPRSNFYVKDVARATSAAPTYFEVARIKSLANVPYPLVDGGVFANNPSLCAYAEARKFDHKPTAKDMVILSLGTGEDKDSYPYKKAKDWGQLAWIKPLLNIMMSGVSETVDYQLKQIFHSVGKPEQYLRIQTDIPPPASSEMDNASPENMTALRDLGEKAATRFESELDQMANLLVGDE